MMKRFIIRHNSYELILEGDGINFPITIQEPDSRWYASITLDKHELASLRDEIDDILRKK